MSLDDVRRAVSFAGLLAFCSKEALKEKARLAAGMAREKAKWAWRHRTKTAGSLTMGLGGLKTWALTHPTIHLWGEGYLLLICGGTVTAIGAYNTLAEMFGWKDDPDP